MLKLTLTKRPGKIGKAINTRTEMHGTEEVPGLDIPVGGILISEEELCLLCDEPTAGLAFFKEGEEGGSSKVPRIQALGIQYLDHKFENAVVRITGTSIDNVTFEGARIKDIGLKPLGGGQTLMQCKLQVHPPAHFDVPAFLNAKVSIGIKSAELERDPDNEPELPMDHSQGDGDEIGQAMNEEDEATRAATGSPDIDETISRTGRAINRSAAKKRGRKKD